jgi:tetratricopeptide (TPR) repeat protein
MAGLPARSTCQRPSRRRLAAALLLAAAASGAAPASGQAVPAAGDPASEESGIELTVPVQQALQRLQEEWLQWVTAYYRGDRDQAAAAVAALRGVGEQLGMWRLPELARGAAVRAVQSARTGDFERAGWGLAAADQLDPRRPETAFAAATVARLEGRYLAALRAHLRGHGRVLLEPRLRTLWLHQAGLWLLYVLVLTGAGCAALQMAVKGERLVSDLHARARRYLPRGVAALAVGLGLLWPLVLPWGALWLLLYWVVLLWRHGSAGERVVLAALALLLGLAPVAVAAQQERLSVRLSPPAHAMDLVAQRRLTGTLFADLATLRSLLPTATAVHHLLADLHRLLGQWELARPLYHAVLDAEPDNAAALVGLGAYHFRKADYGRAADYFQRAADADPRSAAAHYDLGLAYSEVYQFNDSRRALEAARRIDDLLVGGWIREPSADRVVTPDGGLRRIEEIRGQLAVAWQGERSGGSPGGGLATLAAALAALAAAALLGRSRRRGARPPVAGGRRWRWGGMLVPGLRATAEGRPGRAFLAVAVVTALVLWPFASRFGHAVPLNYRPPPLLPGAVAVTVALAWLAWSLRAAWRRG